MQGDLLALPFEDASFDAATVGFGVRNVADLPLALRELRRVLRPGGRLAILEITQPRGPLRLFFHVWFEKAVPLLGKMLPGGAAYSYLPASVKRFPDAERAGSAVARRRLRRCRVPAARRVDRRAAHRGGRVTTLTAIHATPGLAGYMAEVEAGLAQAVSARPGLAADVAGEALSAGGKRLRPLLCFLTADDEPSAAAAVAVELVHMATLVHDDLVDGARMRRGMPAAWSVFGPGAALAAGDYLYACAFSVLVRTGDERAVATLADAALCLARGEAMQRTQTRDPDTTIDAYLERCALKTGKLIEAACLLGSGGDTRLGAYGMNIGIAFQIADDILDCAGQTQETGKIPGTDLREGTPTMPLLLAAQQDPVVRSALAGGPLDGALVRVGLTDALSRSREAALDYAARARSFLDSEIHREELEALTYAIVDRAG